VLVQTSVDQVRPSVRRDEIRRGDRWVEVGELEGVGEEEEVESGEVLDVDLNEKRRRERRGHQRV